MASANTRIIDITVGELLEILNKQQNAANTEQLKTLNNIQNKPEGEQKYIKGITGIAELFNCSKTTANKIKQSGKIDKAITQVGRKFIVDVNLALKLLDKKK